MDLAILQIAPDGIIVLASRNAPQILGKSGLVGRHWTVILDAIQTGDREPLIRGMRTLNETEGVGEDILEGSFKTLGAVPIAAWTLRRMEGADGLYQTAMLLRETQNAETSRAPLDDLASYKDTFDNAVEGFFRTTLDGRYIRVNPALARLYGYDSPESLMDNTRDVGTQLYVDPDRRSQFIRLVRTQGFVSAFEAAVYRADGSVIWIAEYARTVCDEAGSPKFYEGSVIDITLQKRAEEALRESEEKFRLLVEGANVLPWEADLETWRFTYVGPQAVHLLGFPQTDWLRPGFWEQQVHEEDRGWVTTLRAETVKNQANFECEYRLLASDGRTVWVREVASIIALSSHSQILGGFTFDITNRRFAEEAHRRGPQFVENLTRAAWSILYLYDLATKECLFITGRVDQILGYSQRALLDMKPLFVIALSHGAEAGNHAQHWESVAQLGVGQMVEREFRLRSAQGTWVWLRSRENVYIRDRRGNPQQIVGVAIETTAQHGAYEELASNEALFRSLTETTEVIPFEMDLDTGRFTYVGPQAESVLGYPIALWFRREGWLSAVHPDDQEIAMQFMFPPSTHPGPEIDFRAEFRMRTSDGRDVWVRELVRYARGADQRLRARGFLFDITEAKVYEQELTRARDHLRALALRDQNVREDERANVAREIHDELGQALTLFRIDLGWIESRLTRIASQEIGPIIEKTAQLNKLIDGTLHTVRRIISNLRPAVLDELGLKAAIEWQAEEFSRRAGIRCLVHANVNEEVNTDTSVAMFRIFQELLTNVLRHAHASRVNVRLTSEPAYLELAVQDNGRGFSIGELGRKKSFGVLGMRERAQALGGRLQIDTEIGKGTSVIVLLPHHSAGI